MKRKHFIRAIGATALGGIILPSSAAHSSAADLGAKNLDAGHSDKLNVRTSDLGDAPKPSYIQTAQPQNYIMPKSRVNQQPHSEEYWGVVAKNFARPLGFINLENGYFSHQPQATLALHHIAENTINTQSSFFMRQAQTNAIEFARTAFAGFQGWNPENVAFTRNTTESLNIVIMGTQWQAGDEVILGDQDYGSMVEAFQQATARWGIVMKVARIPLHPKSDQEIVEAYTQHITPRTRMLHITHMINLTGQLIPAATIIQKAKQKQPDLVVVIDAAHSLAHPPIDLSELSNAGADVIGGSLHKWLCNPIGVGFLYMRKSLQRDIWPLMGDIGVEKDNIRKFEHQGTRPIDSLQTISSAIEFHRMLGAAPKYNRLVYLKLLWIGNKQALETFGKGMGILNDSTYQKNMQSVTDLTVFDSFKLQSPLFPFSRGGAIATAGLNGYTPTELSATLMSKYQIFTVGIEHPVVSGVRITPHLSNSADDCIQLNKAFTALCVDLIPHLEPQIERR